MESNCKYLSLSPTERSNMEDATLDYSIHHNNNSLLPTEIANNGLTSKSKQSTITNNKSATNSLQQFASSESPQLSSTSSSLSSQSVAHTYEPTLNDFTCAATKANHNLPSSSPANSSYNSSFGSNSGRKLITDSILPGGVVTTQNISTVIRPRSNNNSLQFVKIKTPESSIKAVEQVRIAEENKIGKGRTKEVEEEWQNNLLNWKSKRRQQFSHSTGTEQESANNNMFGYSDDNTCGAGRKIKTFAEMIEDRAKSGNRLGFHLERYIGAEDDEEEYLSLARHQKTHNGSLPSQDTQNKQVLDSDDCLAEPLFSISSGNSDLGDKTLPTVDPTPSPRTTTLTATQNLNQLFRDKPNQLKETVRECDKSHLLGSKSQHDETGNLHSISLVGRPLEADQLSSTLRPSDNNNSAQISLTSQLNEVKAKIDKFRATNKDSSDDSVYEEDEEEDEEEHEEQKQLQRIAFEAKLKAFEKLTQPSSAQPNKNSSTSKPKPPPKRTLANSSMQLDYHDSKPKSECRSFDKRPTATVRQQELQPEVEIVKETMTQELQVAAPIDIRQHSRHLSPRLPSPPTVQLEQTAIEHSPPSPPVPTHRPLSNRLNCKPSASPEDLVSLDSASVRAQTPIDPPSQIREKEQCSKSMSSQSNVTQTQATTPSCQLPLPPPPEPVHVQTIQRNDLSFKNHVPTPRKTPKDDKDRTVLSVSGKKRCSSCKEELGRGAAAFVVESLGLVYHTNCFRCSVCHVNLSNGFRGVDVRVHAGALHCQNCYSKDGLNYSRV